MANLLLMGKTHQRLVREGGRDIDAKTLPPRWGGKVIDHHYAQSLLQQWE